MFVAVLGCSRRIFVKALLSRRQDGWHEGIAAAFMHFGGVVETLLIDTTSPWKRLQLSEQMPMVEFNTPRGFVLYATPEVTALELVGYPS